MQGRHQSVFSDREMSPYSHLTVDCYEKNITLYQRNGIITFLRGETNKPGDDKKVHPLLSTLHSRSS